MNKQADSYQVDVPKRCVDLYVFQDLVSKGSRAYAGRDFAVTASLLSRALELWRGTALAGVPGDWAERVRFDLSQERAKAEKLRFRAETELGPTLEQIERFAAWHADTNPDNEATWLHMQASCKIGRPDRAIQDYRTAEDRMLKAYDRGLDDRIHSLLLRIQDGGPSPLAGHLAGGRDEPGSGASLAARSPYKRSQVQVGSIPPVAGSFQARAVSEELALAMTGPTAGLRSGVLSGLGGVGKTQLAASLARQLREAGHADLLIWVAAQSRQAIVNSYARAFGKITGAAHADEDTEESARRLLDWLESTRWNWLIVLDDLAEPGLVTGLWPPATATGRVLVTTRRADSALASDQRQVVPLGPFTAVEARSYLGDKLASRPGLQPGAEDLAADLGYLPLALSQAAAFMLDRELTCAQYRDRLTERHLADVLPEPGSLPDGQQILVATAWLLSIERANELTPVGVAQPLLELASLLDPAGIPEQVLLAAAVTSYLSCRSGSAVTAAESADGLHCLRRLSLVQLNPSGASHKVQVHSLVQRAVRDRLPPGIFAEALVACADALVSCWPETEADVGLAQSLRANVLCLVSQADDGLLADGVHPVLLRLCRSLEESGNLQASVDQLRKLREHAEERLGHDHVDVLKVRQAHLYRLGQGNDPAEARRLSLGLVRDCRRVLGPDNRDTLLARLYSARWRGLSGDPVGGSGELVAIVADMTRVLGPGHENTLTARSDYAWSRGQAGDPDAVAVITELLTDRRNFLGDDHPHTLISRNNLAFVMGQNGQSRAALRALEELLPDMIRVLGPADPRTLGTRGNIARWRAEAGDPPGAVKELRVLLNEMHDELGPDHPMTATTTCMLDAWERRAG